MFVKSDEPFVPRQVRVPFLRKPIGAGSAIARMTAAAGVQPCGGCKQRAAALDRRIQFVPRGRR